MITGIGIDIIELNRIESSLEKGDRLAARVLTDSELTRYKRFSNKRRQIEYLAGRFAAKEACAKALGTGIGKLSFQHIETIHDESGAPQLTVQGYEGYVFLLSISHSKEYAVAQVVVQKNA